MEPRMFLHISKVSINARQAGLFFQDSVKKLSISSKKRSPNKKKNYFLAGTLEISLEMDPGTRVDLRQIFFPKRRFQARNCKNRVKNWKRKNTPAIA